MHCRLDVSTREEAQRVTRVDGQAAVQGLRPLPITRLVVADLQGGNRLAKQEGYGSQVGVAPRPQAVAELLDLLGRELGVLHVAQVGLVVRLPPVEVGEEVFGKLQREGNQMIEGV